MKNRFFLFAFLTLIAVISPAQQPTRSELLKLFYEAHTAQKSGNIESTIDAYKSILRLSPGLPDPYLQLGNLYFEQTDNILSQQRSLICFNQYLKLRPDAEDASEIEKKMDVLKTRIEILESEEEEEMEEEVVEDVENVPVIAADISQEEGKEPSREEETKPVMPIEVNITRPSTAFNEDVLGTWASVSTSTEGREDWILDFSVLNDKLNIHLNDSSYIKNNKHFAGYTDLNTEGYVSKDTYNFIISVRLEENVSKGVKRSKLKNLSEVLSGMFDVDLDELLSDDPVDSSESDSLNRDATFAYWKKIYKFDYEFNLHCTPGKMEGEVNRKMYDISSGSKLMSESKSNVVLVKAPEGYSGFTYHRLNEADLATNSDLKTLFNKKIEESSTNSSASNDLGCMYESGIGVKRNIKMAVAHFKDASLKNNLFGMLNMARYYFHGIGISNDTEKALTLYKKAFDSGFSDAMVECGDSYLYGTTTSEPDYKKAVSCYQEARMKRSPAAAHRLGLMYLEGWGVPKDTQMALNYFNMAMDSQYLEAIADMGSFYLEGKLVEQDDSKALELLLKAANKGNFKAMSELSRMYLLGIGVKPDFVVAKDWLMKSKKAQEGIMEGYNTISKEVTSILNNK